MVVLAPTLGPLTALRAYLINELPLHGIVGLPVAISPPAGPPVPWVQVQHVGTSRLSLFTNRYMLRVAVFDTDAVVCERRAGIISGLVLGANHAHIVTADGDVWISGVDHQAGPGSIDAAYYMPSVADAAISMFGQQITFFWVIAPKPI